MRAVEANADAATETMMKNDLKKREEEEREGGSWGGMAGKWESKNEKDPEVDANRWWGCVKSTKQHNGKSFIK
jgi:hypothetical protein